MRAPPAHSEADGQLPSEPGLGKGIQNTNLFLNNCLKESLHLSQEVSFQRKTCPTCAASSGNRESWDLWVLVAEGHVFPRAEGREMPSSPWVPSVPQTGSEF